MLRSSVMGLWSAYLTQYKSTVVEVIIVCAIYNDDRWESIRD